MTTQAAVLTGTRIGIVGKGGSGKSTLTVLLARALRKYGYEVCILDADSTNVGLHKALGIAEAPISLIDYFGGMVFSGGAVTCPVDDPTPLAKPEIPLTELQGQYVQTSEEGICLLTAGKIGDMGPGAGCDGPISKIARDFRLKDGASPPTALVDFKAGFEDSARGVITSLDWVIVAVDPTTAAVRMAVHLRDMVRQLQAGRPPATAHLECPELIQLANTLFRESRVRGVLPILNRVPDEETETYLQERLQDEGLRPIAVVPQAPGIMSAWLKGEPLPHGLVDKALDGAVLELERAERSAVVEMSGER